MNNIEKEYMNDKAKVIGEKIKNFVKNKEKICMFVLAKDRKQNDLFAPCVYLFFGSDIDGKFLEIYNDRDDDFDDVKNNHDVLIYVRCISGEKRDITYEEISQSELLITVTIINDIFQNEDYFETLDFGF